MLSQIRLRMAAAAARLTYHCSGLLIDEQIALHHIPCPLGGSRPLFLCPGCGRRVAVLLLRGTRFRCRHCHDLPYRCQSEGAVDRAFRAQWKKEARLDSRGRRPVGMRQTTYQRLRSEIIAIKGRRLSLLYALLMQEGAAL